NTLTTEWTLNGTSLSNAVDNIILMENDMVEGSNTLTAVVTDHTPLLRVDGHETVHLYTVTWTIEVTTLGITTISDENNRITINLYPNPVADVMHVNVESQIQQEFTISLVGIDGKKVLSTTADTMGTSILNLENLSAGMYILSVFKDGVPIAQRKIIKH